MAEGERQAIADFRRRVFQTNAHRHMFLLGYRTGKTATLAVPSAEEEARLFDEADALYRQFLAGEDQ